MRRGASLLAAALAASALLATAAGAEAPTRIAATARDTPEMHLLLSPAAIPKADPGPAEITFYNAGEDPHDLLVRRVGGRARHRYPEVAPGGSHPLELKLRPDSRYRLWCTLPGHRDQGMEATLRVRRR
jgi:plastocyanin